MVLLQAGAPAGGGMSTILMIVAMIAIFYFMMIRPQNKKQKELKRQRESMKTGTRVVTAGGIHGKIKDIKNNGQLVMIEIATGVVIRVDINSVFPVADSTSSGKTAESKSEGKGDNKKKLTLDKEDSEETEEAEKAE